MTDIQKAVTDIERAKEQLEDMKQAFLKQAKASKESDATTSEYYYDGIIFGVQLALKMVDIYTRDWRVI